jgi:hypothetical protein
MNDRRRTWIAMIIISIAGLILFGLGINWGLWTPDVDNFLRTAGGSLGSGAQIDHLAGDWLTDPNAASDIETHPIADRTRPVTLLENSPEMSEAQLIASGNSELIAIQKKTDAAEQSVARAIATHADEDALSSAQIKANDLEKQLCAKLDAAENARSPGITEKIKSDAVTRARIIRRYRLYSFQPDEMITFRALAGMHPGALKLDPRLYQYGGLWIYPIGALLQAAGAVGFVEISDREFYLDNPAAFGKFYIIARAYSAAWGIFGGLVIFALLRDAVGGHIFPIAGALCFLSMPVVVDLAHEAKPHLAGTTLILLAILLCMKYVETGKLKWFIATSLACGAAAAMVLSGVVGFILLPVTLLLRARPWKSRLLLCFFGVLISSAVYFATNPYVAIHLLYADQRAILTNNLANTSAMYSHGPFMAGVVNAVRLIAAGTSFPLLFLAVGGVLVLAISRTPHENLAKPSRPLGWLLTSVSVVIVAQFIAYAAGKPGEYGRFALFVDVALMLAAVVAAARFTEHPAWRAVVAPVLIAATLSGSIAYERGFLQDSSPENSRTHAAALLQKVMQNNSQSVPTLYVTSEPAPYCLPPVDLYRWRIILLPKGIEEPPAAGILVAPDQTLHPLDLNSTPISWAAKPFRLMFEAR